MAAFMCPKCKSPNEDSAQTCTVCGATLPDVEAAVDRWWNLSTVRSRLKAIGLVLGLAWLFSPIGGLQITIALIDALAQGPLQANVLEVLGGLLYVTTLGILSFPVGLTGYAPGLTELMSSQAGVLIAGWLIYIIVVAAILLNKQWLLVRVLFLVFVILVIWNTVGCYPVVEHILAY